jgi:hypothetical protein
MLTTQTDAADIWLLSETASRIGKEIKVLALNRQRGRLDRLECPKNCPSHRACFTARIRAPGYGMFSRSALIRARSGNVGFRVLLRPSTSNGRALPKRKAGFWSSSASGHRATFASPPNQVGHLLETRPSGATVGNPSVCRPNNAPGRTHTLCHFCHSGIE